MILFYFIPLLFGYFAATRLLREREIATVAVLSFALGLTGVLFFVNPLFYFMPLPWSLALALVLMAVLSIILKFRKVEKLYLEPISRGQWISLGTFTLIIALYTNYLHVVQLDDDYWIHTALMGLFHKGQFPPLHPFFPYIDLPGHYGRDLTISALSLLTGGNFLTVQWVLTVMIQPVIFLLIYFWIRNMTRNPLQALFCSLFIFFGVNVGSRTGLFDIVQNNNPFVYLYLFLIVYIFFQVLREFRWPAALLCAFLLGIYPVVYESHYGLLCLAMGALSLLLIRSGEKPDFKPLLAFLLITALSLPLAVFSGGLFSAKFKHRSQWKEQQTINELSNSQKVTIKFPKKELFQIYLGVGNYQRLSVCFPIFFPFTNNERYFNDYRYAALWSPSFLLLVWFPFFLAPFTIVFLYIKRHYTGIFLWLFGLISTMVPALVNFGPVFEEEYFRWIGAAGIGFAGALGIVVASLIQVTLTTREDGKLPPSRRFAMAGIVLFIAVNCIGAACYFNYMLVEYEKKYTGKDCRIKVSWHGLPAPLPLLSTTCPDFQKVDEDACAFLKARSVKGDTALRYFDEKSTLDLFPESTVAGLGGVNLMGHTFPPFERELRASPFRMNHRARAFWSTGDSMFLDSMTVHWLYLDPARIDGKVLEKILSTPSLRKVYDTSDGEGRRRIILENMAWKGYHNQRFRPIPPDSPAFQGLAVTGYRLPEKLEASKCYKSTITLRKGGNEKSAIPENASLSYLFHHRGNDGTLRPAVSFDRVEIPLGRPDASGEYSIELPLVTPYGDGIYCIFFYLIDGEHVYPLKDETGEIKMEVNYPAGKEEKNFVNQK